MQNAAFRPALLALAAMAALAIPNAAMAADEAKEAPAVPASPAEATETVEGTAAPTGTGTGTAMPAYGTALPFPMRPAGGTAVINFIAPVTPKTVADLVKHAQNAVIGGAEGVRINISSPGGSVAAMQFAVNVLRTLPVPVETAAMSSIASAAVSLFCMGEKRYMGEGANLYLHQQTGYPTLQDKTVGALIRKFELNNQWYDALLYGCIDADADRAALDYSSRDVVIDVDQATALGMVTGPVSDLRDARIWGMVMNVSAPEPQGHAIAYPAYR